MFWFCEWIDLLVFDIVNKTLICTYWSIHFGDTLDLSSQYIDKNSNGHNWVKTIYLTNSLELFIQ